MATIQVLHGPNLNLLGSREPSVYGTSSLDVINQSLKKQALALNHHIDFLQSNSEADLVTKVQQSQRANFIIINPAAFTHTSVALRDAMLAIGVPFIEVHLSNVYQRESFRHHSYFSDIAVGVIAGLGAQGYQLALTAADHYLAHH